MILQRRSFLASAALAMPAPAIVRADSFPAKPIRWVIPFAPGGNYDVTSRIVADPMSRQLGQTVLIDNRPGAGGVVGLEAAVNAPADGYTIVMASFTVGYVAPIFAGKPQMLQVLAPVSMLTTSPTLRGTRAWTAASPTSRSFWPKQRPSPARSPWVIRATARPTTWKSSACSSTNRSSSTSSPTGDRGRASPTSWPARSTASPTAHQLDAAHPVRQAARLVNFGLDRIPDLPDVPTLKEAGCTPFEGGTTAGVFGASRRRRRSSTG